MSALIPPTPPHSEVGGNHKHWELGGTMRPGTYMHDDSYEHRTQPEQSPGWVRPMSSQPFFRHVADRQELLEILDPSRAKYTLH